MFIVVKSPNDKNFHIMDYNEKTFFTTLCGKKCNKPKTISFSMKSEPFLVCKVCHDYFNYYYSFKLLSDFRYIRSTLIKDLIFKLTKKRNKIYLKFPVNQKWKMLQKIKSLVKKRITYE